MGAAEHCRGQIRIPATRIVPVRTLVAGFVMVHEVFCLHFIVSNELENIQEPRVIQQEGRHPVEIFAPRKIWPRIHSRNLLLGSCYGPTYPQQALNAMQDCATKNSA